MKPRRPKKSQPTKEPEIIYLPRRHVTATGEVSTQPFVELRPTPSELRGRSEREIAELQERPRRP